MIKTGYFRITGSFETTMSYQEFYERGKEFRRRIEQQEQDGKISLFCACTNENTLPLTVTKNLVLRVKSNNQQTKHLDSCPKSEHYTNWVAEHNGGQLRDEEGHLCFNVSFPSGIKSEKNGSGSSSTQESNNEKNLLNKRASILQMVSTVNMYTWLRQTYSVKKTISDAHRQGITSSWNYKSIEDFNKHFFGVSNEVYLQHGKEIITLHSLCYQKSTFYGSDYKEKYFMYALVECLPDDNTKDRKYQYVKVRMPSEKSNNRAVIRINTEDYQKMLVELNLVDDETSNLILTGYIRHDTFPGKNGEVAQWITLLKGVFFRVSNNGLYSESNYIGQILDLLAKNHIIFHRPMQAIENFGGNQPTAVIQRFKDKDIIVDVAKNSLNYNSKSVFITDNPEFDVVLIKTGTPINEVCQMLLKEGIQLNL